MAMGRAWPSMPSTLTRPRGFGHCRQRSPVSTRSRHTRVAPAPPPEDDRKPGRREILAARIPWAAAAIDKYRRLAAGRRDRAFKRFRIEGQFVALEARLAQLHRNHVEFAVDERGDTRVRWFGAKTVVAALHPAI